MGAGIRVGPIEFTDLRLRLEAVEGRVRSILLRLQDGTQLAEGDSAFSYASADAAAKVTLVGPGTDRRKLLKFGMELGAAAFPGRVAEFLMSEYAKGPVRIRVSATA